VQLSSQLLFFFSALGAFNGLLLSFYLFFGNTTNGERKWLAGLLLAISLRISKSVWFYFDPNLGKAFLQFGLTACFFIGPMLFFYVARVNRQLDKLTLPWQWHLVTLAILSLAVGFVWPYAQYPELWQNVIYKFINLTWAGYILAAFYIMLPKAIVWLGDNTSLSTAELLCAKVSLGTFLIWLAYFTSSYTSYLVGALSFSFVLYLSVVTWLFEGQQRKTEPYADKKISKDVEQSLSSALTHMMTDEKLYKNANLTLPIVAKKLGVSVPQLSQLLNDNLNQSFAVFINKYRIEEAKRLLMSEPNLTMELVAEQAGYNSQSTFYSAFKKFEQTTPAKYRKVCSKL